jgi:hypothetical protein
MQKLLIGMVTVSLGVALSGALGAAAPKDKTKPLPNTGGVRGTISIPNQGKGQMPGYFKVTLSARRGGPKSKPQTVGKPFIVLGQDGKAPFHFDSVPVGVPLTLKAEYVPSLNGKDLRVTARGWSNPFTLKPGQKVTKNFTAR